MKKVLLLICTAANLLVSAQSISFGAEVMPKKNFLTGGNNSDVILENQKPQFIVVDRVSDSLGFFFTNFSSANNIEVPVYLRLKTKKRWSFDFSYSLSKYSIQASGKTAYVGNFYEKYYSQQSFSSSVPPGSTQAQSDSLYQLYLNKWKDYWTDDFSYVENCRVRSFGFTATYRFSPHKAYKPYALAGFVYRRKVSNYSFQSFAMENSWVNDVAKVSEGIEKFSTNLVYFRMGAGVETYRFRAGINFDVTGAGTPSGNYQQNNRIVGRQSGHAYTSIMSLGFYLGADLFNYDLASKKQNTEAASGVTEVPKVNMKQDKWSLGVRFNNSAKCNLTGYYSANVPLTIISLHDIPDPNNSSGNWDTYVNMLAIKDISVVDNRPRIEAFARINFLKKFIVEGHMGYNNLNVDWTTTELRAKMYYNTDSSYYIFDNAGTKYTKLYTGVFRKSWGVFNTGLNLMYECVSKDLLKVRLSGGLNINVMISNNFQVSDKDNVNSSELSYDFNNWVEKGAPTTMNDLKSGAELNFAEQKFEPNIYGSTSDFANQYASMNIKTVTNDSYLQYYTPDQLFTPKEPAKSFYAAFRVGGEAEFNRFLLGVNYEANLGYVQGVLLKNYTNLSLSLGYLFLKK